MGTLYRFYLDTYAGEPTRYADDMDPLDLAAMRALADYDRRADNPPLTYLECVAAFELRRPPPENRDEKAVRMMLPGELAKPTPFDHT